MKKLVRQCTAAVAVSFAAVGSSAHASALIDFESVALAGIYQPGSGLSQGGFTMTPAGDLGIVGRTGDFVDAPPMGNDTQFFFNRNDGSLTLRATGGGLFNLDGFSAAFVPQVPSPVPVPTIVFVALGIQAGGASFRTVFDFGSSDSTSFPFIVFDRPADFGQFNNLVEAQFYACVQDKKGGVCVTPTNGNGQFALDDIRVTAANPVPEPAAWALALAALVGLALTRRRSA